MNNINFKNEEEFKNSTYYYDSGFESKLYRYVYDDKEFMVKKYYNQDQINREKIKRISSLQTEELLKPKNFVSIDGTVVGFLMDFQRGCYPLFKQKEYLSYEQKCHLIIQLKKILLSLREEGCLYGDLNIKNILTDGEQVYLCDSINVEIDNYTFDEISSTMRKYIQRTKTTEGIDFYMLNLLTVYLFNEIEYDDIVDNIELVVMNMFNKQPYDEIIGVTDSMDTLNKCCDIFLSNKACDELLMDHMNLSITEYEDGVSKAS